MTSPEKIKAGFETSSGADQYVTSLNSYNDNQWHYAVVTYGGSTVILYVDGVQVGTKATSGASPETSGTKPVRVGAEFQNYSTRKLLYRTRLMKSEYGTMT